MSTLTSEDFRWIKKFVQADQTFSNEFKTWGITKQQFMSSIQAIEDWLVFSYNGVPTTSMKSTIEAITGNVTVPQAKTLIYALFAWRGEFKI